MDGTPPKEAVKMIYHTKCGLPVDLCACLGGIRISDDPPKEPSADETIRNLYRC